MRRAQRASLRPGREPSRRLRGKHVAPALVASLGLHLAFVLYLARVERRVPVARPETIEIVIDGPTDPKMPADPVPSSTRAIGSARYEGSRTPAMVKRGVGKLTPPLHPADTGTESAPVGVPTPGPSEARAQPDEPARDVGWATFGPARPDLSVAGKLGPPPEQPRDLLAAPRHRSPAAERELPRTLHGTGGVEADVAEDGTLRFRDASSLSYDVARAAGRLDVTDAIMRGVGQDPYAAAKRKLADDTREERICMAKRTQDKRQSQALVGLATHVKQIARRVDLTPLERRQLLFEIWDECSEGRGDAPVDYGATARAIIAAVIRETFPAGSQLGYSTAELASLNQRRTSLDRFAPYDVKRDAGVPNEAPPAGSDCP